MLHIKQVTLKYTTQDVVKNLSLTIEQGERLVILGASGCGKTTLLKAISGYHPIHNGTITFNGENVLDPTEQLVPGHETIKLVNQDFQLDSFHTVEENIRIRLLQFDTNYLSSRVEELLKLTELANHRNALAKNLSGGQKQRLSIARALADEPELLLLDEPFNQLDYHLKHKIESYILTYLSKYNISAILVTHNGEEAMRWADKIAFMRSGKLVRIDSVENFYNHPQNNYEAAFFGKINTVIIAKKEISFRPHNYSKHETESYTLNIIITFKTKINKGWYTEFVFNAQEHIITLFSQNDLSELTTIWIKTTSF